MAGPVDSAFRDRMMAATRIQRSEERAMQERIGKLYTECAKDMEKTIAKYGAEGLTGRRADLMQKSMRAYTKALWRQVETLAKEGVQSSALRGVEVQSSMLDDLLHGIGVKTSTSFASFFGRTQDEAVAAVLNGSIYAGKNAALSKRIWNNAALQGGQIERILATGVAEGRSAVQVAKDLEAYVNPKARMPDHWNETYPCPFLHRVDYNAKRLAVTAMNHGYYQGMMLAARDNPFAEFLHWELSSTHDIYDVCDTYMEHDEGLGLGNFRLDNAPLPHPWCRCTYYVDSSKSLKEIGQEVADWIDGGENKRLDEVLGEWFGNAIDNSGESGIMKLPDIKMQHSLGAKSANSFSFDAPDGSGTIFSIPGEYVRNVKVFAGKGTNSILRDAQRLETVYHIPENEWMKVKGRSWVLFNGEEYFGELHWYQAKGIGRVEYKLKIQPDGRWWCVCQPKSGAKGLPKSEHLPTPAV